MTLRAMKKAKAKEEKNKQQVEMAKTSIAELEKQKEGKKRMRQFGTVEVPQEAFTAVLKYDDNK